ncbi:MAG: MATE family efflux transporter [Peptostreptococcaceae bacterium]
MEENILGSKSVHKLFIKYSLPAIISMVITGMQTMVDGMFVGNILGPNAIASVNIAAPFMQLIIALAMIMSIGSQSYMGLSLGDKNIEKTQNIFKTAIILILGLGFIITIFGFTMNHKIAKLLGSSEVLMDNVSVYIKTLSIFTVPMCLMFLFGFSGRIIEKPQLYFYGSILSLVVNITLNYILIYKLRLGMVGAATATGFAYSSAFLVVVWPMLNKNNVINIFSGKFDKSTVMPVIYNGSSEGVNSISTATSAYLFNMAFMNIAGEMGVAAFTSINYVAQFGILLMFGVSDGIGPIVSYNYGSKDFDRVKSIMKLSNKVLMLMGTGIFTILFFFGTNLVTAFVGNNKEILEIATMGAKIYAFAFFMNGFNIVNSGYFTYIGNAKESVIVAASRGLIFIFVGIFILPIMFGTNGIWMSIPFAEFVAILIGFKLMKNSYKAMDKVTIQCMVS